MPGGLHSPQNDPHSRGEDVGPRVYPLVMAQPSSLTLNDERLADCSCCGLPRIAKRERDADDRRPQRCAPCWAHADANLQKQSEHREWWQAYRKTLLGEVEAARATAGRAEQIANGLATALEDLRRGVIADIDSDAEHPLHVYLANAKVTEAQQKVDASYRTRDRAMRAIWYIDARHNEKLDGRCACGQTAASCRDLQALIPVVDELRKWESDQVQRMHQGRTHGLPAEHESGPRGGWSLDWKGARTLQEEIVWRRRR